MPNKTCACGCGEIVRRKYLPGHNRSGYKMSPKTKELLSKVNTGKRHSAQTKSKIRRSVQTLYDDPVFKKKFVSAVNTVKHRRAISEANRGAGNGHWKGEWEKLHPHVSLVDFRRLRQRVILRDRSCCVNCGKKVMGRNRQVHHVVPVRIAWRSKLCDHIANLVTLCGRCHRVFEPRSVEVEVNRDKWKEFLPRARKYLASFSYQRTLLIRYMAVSR